MHRFTNDTLFANAFQHAGIGIAIMGLDGDWLRVNPSLCKLTGYSENELLKLTFQEITHPDDLNIDLLNIDSLKEGDTESYEMEKRYFHKNGKIIWASLTVSIFRDEQKNPQFFIVQIQEITKRKEAEVKLRLYGKVIESTTQGVTITNAEGTIIYVNEAFKHITGYSQDEVIGRNPRMLKSGKHKDSFYRHLWMTLQLNGSWQGEIWNKNKSGDIYPEWLNISAVKDNQGNVEYYVAVFSNILELKEAERKLLDINEQLNRLSTLDGLTGIANRRAFDEKLNLEYNRAKRLCGSLSLILVDIDYFKKYNDTYGHQMGDECLKEVAKALKATANRATDLVARYGGEEFAVILPDTVELGAIMLAENLRKNIENLKIPHLNSSVSDYVTISVGVATLHQGRVDAITQEELISITDKALYEAKQGGRNRVKGLEGFIASI